MWCKGKRTASPSQELAGPILHQPAPEKQPTGAVPVLGAVAGIRWDTHPRRRVAIQHEAVPKFGLALFWQEKEGLHLRWHSVPEPVQGHTANEDYFVVRSAGWDSDEVPIVACNDPIQMWGTGRQRPFVALGKVLLLE